MANIKQYSDILKKIRLSGQIKFLIFIFYLIIYIFIINDIIKKNIRTRANTGKYTNWDVTFGSLAGVDTQKLSDQQNFLQTNHQASTIMNPLANIGQQLQQQQADLNQSLNSQRDHMSGVRNTFGNITGNIVNRIADATSVLQFLFLKLINLFERIFGIFSVLIYIMLTTVSLIGSTISGPIGEFACFDSDTLINIQDFDTIYSVYISKLKLNNILQDRKKIISLMKFKNIYSLYSYQGVIVSGSHLVLHQGKYQRIDKIKCLKLLNHQSSLIYCLNTQNNIINSQTLQFRDYNETNNAWINNYIKQTVLKCLNLQSFKSDCKSILAEYYFEISKSSNNHYYIAGFSENQVITLLDGSKKKISELEIDDIMEDQQMVEGVIIHQNMEESCYQINNILVTGSSIIKFENQWILVNQHPDAKIISYSGYYYNIVTSKNYITLEQQIFRDFIETNNLECNQYIDRLVEEYLNSYSIK